MSPDGGERYVRRGAYPSWPKDIWAGSIRMLWGLTSTSHESVAVTTRSRPRGSLIWQFAKGADGLLHLTEVGAAAAAHADMHLEAQTLMSDWRPLKVIRDELVSSRQLNIAQVRDKYRSSTARTFDLPRCKSTR